MARVKMTNEQAQALRSRPVAKGKHLRQEREHDRELEKEVKVVRVKKAAANAKPELHPVSGGAVKAIAEESMARVYREVFTGMSTHDEDGVVDREISEEAYILTLTMIVGNDVDLPRQGLSMKEDAKASAHMISCKECENDG